MGIEAIFRIASFLDLFLSINVGGWPIEFVRVFRYRIRPTRRFLLHTDTPHVPKGGLRKEGSHTQRHQRYVYTLSCRFRQGLNLYESASLLKFAGFEYQWSYSDEEQRNDAVIENVLLVSRDYELYLMGLELDYSFDDFESMFKFNNPKAKSTCGCGTSFSIGV